MQIGFLIGRIIYGVYLLYSGIHGLMGTAAMAGFAASKGVPAAGPAVFIAHLLLIFAGFCFLTGWKPHWGVIAVVVFLVPVTIAMHDFWNAPEERQMGEMVNFTKNFALMGASLMFLAIPRPWAYSVEGRRTRRVIPPGALPA